MYINKVQIIGNITKNPELKALPSGVKVSTISVATNRVWKDQNGSKQESVEFHDIIAFGKQAETIAQYMTKGNQIFVEGRLQTRSWESSDGQKRYKTEIVLESFQFGNNKTQEKKEVKEEKVQDGVNQDISYPEEEINVDDIPF